MQNVISRIVLPLIVFVIVLGMPLWDKLSPMDGADDVLTKEFGGHFAWCIGYAFSSSPEATVYQRVYVLFPQVFSHPSIVLVRAEDDHNPTLDTVSYGVLLVVIVYASLGFALLRMLQRRSTLSSDQENESSAGTIHR